MSKIITNKNELLDVENWPAMLITTEHWFYAPDGRQYKGVYGKANIIQAKALLGFNPTHSTNWMLEVGGFDKKIIVMGCQIHYACLCTKKPILHEHVYDTTSI